MKIIKNKNIENEIENETQYVNCIFMVGSVEAIENSEFVNCSFRKKIEIGLLKKCKFESCNFVNLLIKEQQETEIEQCIFPKIEGIPLEISLGSWNGEYFDFTTEKWGKLDHEEQREYATAYQRWSLDEKKAELARLMPKEE